MVEESFSTIQSEGGSLPNSVKFIIGLEFCERFHYYGIRSILAMYLHVNMNYDQQISTEVCHIFIMLLYTSCLCSAFLSDSLLGEIHTIMVLSVVNIIGTVAVILAMLLPFKTLIILGTLLGLLAISIGSGGIKPCITSLGAKQFQLPEQEVDVTFFFSTIYFTLNLGSVFSTITIPALRNNVHCFGEKNCSSLAFLVTAIFMGLGLVIFTSGLPFYNKERYHGFSLRMVLGAIQTGMYNLLHQRRLNPKAHFLDYAMPRYGTLLVNDTKILLRILILFLPIPCFYALFEQQFSRWVFQALLMDRHIGSFEIMPEYLQVLNPILVLVLIPIFHNWFYPLLAKVGIQAPIQKMVIGGFIAAIAFFWSGLIEIMIYHAPSDPHHSQLRIFNGVNGCDYTVKTDIPNMNVLIIKQMSSLKNLNIDVSTKSTYNFAINSNSTECGEFSQKLSLEPGIATGCFINNKKGKLSIDLFKEITTPLKGDISILRVLANVKSHTNIIVENEENETISVSSSHPEVLNLIPGVYDIFADTTYVTKHRAKQGQIINIVVTEVHTEKIIHEFYQSETQSNINILWQLPQYILITMGEIMISVTGYEFSFKQAPYTMKAALQACWLLCIALGNLIVIIVSSISYFRDTELFIFSGLMILDTILFMLIARNYQPHDPMQNVIMSDSEEY